MPFCSQILRMKRVEWQVLAESLKWKAGNHASMKLPTWQRSLSVFGCSKTSQQRQLHEATEHASSHPQDSWRRVSTMWLEVLPHDLPP